MLLRFLLPPPESVCNQHIFYLKAEEDSKDSKEQLKNPLRHCRCSRLAAKRSVINIIRAKRSYKWSLIPLSTPPLLLYLKICTRSFPVPLALAFSLPLPPTPLRSLSFSISPCTQSPPLSSERIRQVLVWPDGLPCKPYTTCACKLQRVIHIKSTQPIASLNIRLL